MQNKKSSRENNESNNSPLEVVMSKQSSVKGPAPVAKISKPIFDEMEQAESKDDIENEEDDNEEFSESV